MRPRVLALSALLFAAAATARAQEPVLLRLGGVIGRPIQSRMVVAMYLRGGPFAAMGADTTVPTMRQLMFATQTLDSVKGDTLSFTAVIDSARAESPAMPSLSAMMESALAAAPKRSTVRMDSRGRLLALDAPGVGGFGAAAGGPLGGSRGGFGSGGPGYALPEQPVRVGDTWSTTTNLTGLPGDAATSGSMQYRLERIEPRGGAGTAVISMSGDVWMSFAGTQAEMPTSGILRFDIAAGRVTAMSATVAYLASGPMGDMTGRIELTHAELGDSAPPPPVLRLPAAAPLPRPTVPPSSPPPGAGTSR